MTCVPSTVSPRAEMISYETLWSQPGQTLKSLTALFRQYPFLPSLVLAELSRQDLFSTVWSDLRESVEAFLAPLRGFSVSLYRTFQYPPQLREARHPVELFYYNGDLTLTESPCVSVVGARKSSDEGKAQARDIAGGLVRAGYTIVSGLAAGIDTAAMTSAIKADGSTIGVIGTPVNQVYPRENEKLQRYVAARHLLISQVPFYRYQSEPFPTRSRHFTERNETMAALSSATIIVEASDRSGSLTQARACLYQGRKLMIMQSCFDRGDITWPAYYERRGAIRVSCVDEILGVLAGVGSTLEADRSGTS